MTSAPTQPDQPERTSGMAVTSLVLGIVGFCTSVVSLILSVIMGS